jgi:hypothetical protein
MGRDAPAHVGRVRMAGRLWPGNWTLSSVTLSLMMTFAMPVPYRRGVVGDYRHGPATSGTGPRRPSAVRQARTVHSLERRNKASASASGVVSTHPVGPAGPIQMCTSRRPDLADIAANSAALVAAFSHG